MDRSDSQEPQRDHQGPNIVEMLQELELPASAMLLLEVWRMIEEKPSERGSGIDGD